MKSWQFLLVVGSFVATVGYFTYSQLTTLEEHAEAFNNDQRQKLHVPIIDASMKRDYAADFLFAAHWERRGPSADSVVHVFKTVMRWAPLERSVEKDRYRKISLRDGDLEFDMESIIRNNISCERKGVLRTVSTNESIQLNEKGIDSLASRWGLHDLVRKP